MCHLKPISLLLLAVALACGCQKQSYTDESPASSSTARQLSSSQPAEAKSPASDVKTDADAVVVSSKANLREDPNASSQVIMKLGKGEALNILEEKPASPWYKVRHLTSGKTGWIHGNAIKLTVARPPLTAEQSADDNGISQPARPRRESGTTAGGGGTYINSFGEEVPRPRRSASAPAGASARCRDGTYSFSRNRRGTCSHHGGVAEWL